MKFVIGIILSAFVLQTLALPTFEDPNAPEHMPLNEDSGLEHMPTNEVVNQFRYDIFYWFQRFALFYERANVATSRYRFAHVELVTRVYNQLLTVMGDDIHSIRASSADVRGLLEERRVELGESNECVEAVATDFNANSETSGRAIQACSVYANTTLTRLLEDTFYPAFVDIKNLLATVPVAVVDVLSRGNVLQDEAAMIEYLRGQYQIVEFQWLSAVSQLLRWETNRYETDALFLVDETTMCMAFASLSAVMVNSQLEVRLRACT